MTTPSPRFGLPGAVAVLALTACGVGGVNDGSDGSDGTDGTAGGGGRGGDGGGDDDDFPGLLCMAELSVSGTMIPASETIDEEGCVPNGTWQVSLELVDMEDCHDVQYDGQYTYEVTGGAAEGGYVITYLEDPENPNVFLRVKGQGGACEGNFAHWSADGKTKLLIKPYEEDTAISGSAYFELYDEDQL